VRVGELVGQSGAIAVLQNAIRRDRVAHAYLFLGPDGVGKSTAARWFAQALNCEAPNAREAGAACGECHSCRLAAKGSHPDIRLITPEGKDESSVIPIDAIREDLIYDVHLRPVSGRYKIYILDPADRTAPLATHTLLKALEEPPPYVVTILVTSRPAMLPSTIPSRCQHVAFRLARTEAVQEHLVRLGIEPATAASLARLSGGRTGWAVRVAQRADVPAARKELIEMCAALPTERAGKCLRIAENVKRQAVGLAQARMEQEREMPAGAPADESAPAKVGTVTDRELREELPWCLDVMASWYRDHVAFAEETPLLNPDYQEVLSRAAEQRATCEPEDAIEAILAARQQIQRNANIDLALEDMIIRLLGGDR
jgi:DNA polymerase-3 subunit delta'